MDEATSRIVSKLMHDLRYHNYRYYTLNDPVISDSEYDILYHKYLEYKDKYPELVDEIGTDSGKADIVHIKKMLSLHSTTEIMNVLAVFVHHKTNVSCEPKVDGLAVELIYNNHSLVSASTRGDGTVGEDISYNVSLMSIPKDIDIGGTISIYGEVYLRRTNFNRINAIRSAEGRVLYTNARNTAAGIIRSSNELKYVELLSFFPYDVKYEGFDTQSEMFGWLDKTGFDTLPDLRHLACHITEFDDYRDRMLNTVRKDINYPIQIDGLVFKVDDLGLREAIGTGNKHPKWAIAYKFKNVKGDTWLRDVVFQVGKSGIVAPIGVIDPIVLNGSTITRVNLSNINVIMAKGLMINDRVTVELSLDIIPHISEVLFDERTGNEIEILFPPNCPACGKPLKFISPYSWCTNQECSGRLLGRLLVASGRYGFNMRGIGKGVLADLLLNKIITNHADLFKLDTDQQKQNIMRALGYTEYGIRRIINIVDESRLISLRKFIVALGISDVSIGVAAHLAEHYKSIDRLREIETSEIDPISGINKKTLIGINEFFSCDDSKIIDTYLESGVIVIDDESTKPRFRILITGTLSSVRSEIEERIKKAGCTLAKTISRHVDFIVVGESPSKTKIEAANRLNIKMINEQQLLSILKGV